MAQTPNSKTPNTAAAPTETAAPVAATPVAPPTPCSGGSYLVDEQTGEHRLVERTQTTKE